VGTLALQESKLAILIGMTPGFSEKDPPWEIEGEPEGLKNFDLKRPFEAKESDNAGHISYHKNKADCIKSPSVQQHHRHQNNHTPSTLHLLF